MTCSLFASRSVTSHLLRGAIAAVLLPWAIANASAHPGGALLSVAISVIAMRGCPMCWLVGLVETIAARVRR
jgi:hypothetical protein